MSRLSAMPVIVLSEAHVWTSARIMQETSMSSKGDSSTFLQHILKHSSQLTNLLRLRSGRLTLVAGLLA